MICSMESVPIAQWQVVSSYYSPKGHVQYKAIIVIDNLIRKNNIFVNCVGIQKNKIMQKQLKLFLRFYQTLRM